MKNCTSGTEIVEKYPLLKNEKLRHDFPHIEEVIGFIDARFDFQENIESVSGNNGHQVRPEHLRNSFYKSRIDGSYKMPYASVNDLLRGFEEIEVGAIAVYQDVYRELENDAHFESIKAPPLLQKRSH